MAVNKQTRKGEIKMEWNGLTAGGGHERAVRTLFEVFEHHALLCVLSKHCPNSVRTCHTFVSRCSYGVRSARRAVVCCSNTVRTVWSCLAMFEHFEQCLNCALMPTTCGKSIPFLFYFPLSCLFVYSHPRPPASARTPIRNMSTHPDQ